MYILQIYSKSLPVNSVFHLHYQYLLTSLKETYSFLNEVTYSYFKQFNLLKLFTKITYKLTKAVNLPIIFKNDVYNVQIVFIFFAFRYYQ